MNTHLSRAWVLGLSLLVAGCASVVRDPLPAEYADNVNVLGRSDLRVWGDGVHQRTFANVHNASELEQQYGGIMHRPHDYLVISGGGANGAYGAGILLAWSELGTRPEFTMVTGVSTGALTAPFAFLGPDYDGALKEVYTTLDTTQLVNSRGIVSVQAHTCQILQPQVAVAIDFGIPKPVFQVGLISAVSCQQRHSRPQSHFL